MAEANYNEHMHTPNDDFGLGAVKELLGLLHETDITEVKIERGDMKLHIKRGHANQPPAPVLVTPSLTTPVPTTSPEPLPTTSSFQSTVTRGEPSTITPTENEVPPGSTTITAPMVGTFYTAPSPKDPSFVNEGDMIGPNEAVGIIEAMKIMNEIVFEGDTPGKVTRILVSNGQPVEYGQILMIIEPAI
ncbi:MAG: acetyl-CoA carboxylase biotin carboxyl carrier protein [Chloroflexota bacterium]